MAKTLGDLQREKIRRALKHPRFILPGEEIPVEQFTDKDIEKQKKHGREMLEQIKKENPELYKQMMAEIEEEKRQKAAKNDKGRQKTTKGVPKYTKGIPKIVPKKGQIVPKKGQIVPKKGQIVPKELRIRNKKILKLFASTLPVGVGQEEFLVYLMVDFKIRQGYNEE